MTMEMLKEAEKPALIGSIEPDTVTRFIVTAHACCRVQICSPWLHSQPMIKLATHPFIV